MNKKINNNLPTRRKRPAYANYAPIKAWTPEEPEVGPEVQAVEHAPLPSPEPVRPRQAELPRPRELPPAMTLDVLYEQNEILLKIVLDLQEKICFLEKVCNERQSFRKRWEDALTKVDDTNRKGEQASKTRYGHG